MNKFYTFILSLFISSAFAQSGITWTAGNNIASNFFSNMHPRITLDGSGNPMVIWGKMGDASVYFCNWNGTTFNPPVALNPGWLNIASGSWMGPQIASHGDTVYVVVKQTPEADTASHIYIIRSFDGGDTWDDPILVDNMVNKISRFPTVTVDALGNPIIGFMKFNSDFSNPQWVITRSFNFGTTCTAEVQASGWSGGVVCDCCPGAITSNANNVAMLYRDNDSNIRDSWVGLSTDGGLSVADGWNIDGNNWMLMACPATGPDGEIIGDTLYSVFTNGAGGLYRTYRSKSSISTGMAQPSQLLSGAIPNLNSQNYPRIARYGNAMAIAWQQSVNSVQQLPLLFTSDIANGFPASYDTVDLNHVTNTDVAVGDGKVYVVWEDDNSQTVKYRIGTYTPVSTSVSENAGAEPSVFPNPVSGELKITTASASALSICNAMGAEVYSMQIPSGKNSIDMARLSEGIYFLKLISENKTSVIKIVKQ